MRRLALLLLLALSGCATLMTKDGFRLREGQWADDDRDIRARAAFELSCPGESLTLQVLATFPGASEFAGQVGVTGCDQKVVYVRPYAGGWIANSHSEKPKP